MEFDWNICPRPERCTLQLRALYEQAGYRNTAAPGLRSMRCTSRTKTFCPMRG